MHARCVRREIKGNLVATNATWDVPSRRYHAPCSAECERKRFHARVEKLDLELSINHGFWLSY
jgi:hypothetical protein